MIYKDNKGNYPLYIGDVQLADPDFELGGTLPRGWIGIEEVEPPTPAEGYVTVPLEPTQINGVWTQQWATRPLTAEELERRNAPASAKAKLAALGLTEIEIEALVNGLLR